MKRSLTALAVATLALTGCSNLLEPAAGAVPTSSATATLASDAEPTATARSGLGSVKDSGDIPDPCTLLSKAEVVRLTGRSITELDQDGASPGETTRYCQWQQESGQLAIFLARTTADQFEEKTAEAKPVDGVGQDAYELAGHLYVLYGTVQIDVYSRGGSDDQDLANSKAIAKILISRI